MRAAARSIKIEYCFFDKLRRTVVRLFLFAFDVVLPSP
jgi:hypothetical protein